MITRRRRVALVSMRLFGPRFTRIRTDRGLTQREIASSAGVSESFVSQLVSGDKGCTAETAALIAAALGEPLLPVEHLFDNKVRHPQRSTAVRRPSSPALPEAS